MSHKNEHQPYYVLSVQEEGNGLLTDLHYRNPVRAEKMREALEQKTGVTHAVFFQKTPGGEMTRLKPVGATQP